MALRVKGDRRQNLSYSLWVGGLAGDPPHSKPVPQRATCSGCVEGKLASTYVEIQAEHNVKA
jgi:hypothetical protein